MIETAVNAVDGFVPYLEQIINAQYIIILFLGAMLILSVFFGRR